MGSSGTTTVDFGAFPGKTDVTASIAGQASIVAGSVIAAWVVATATADHSVDEHWCDPPVVRAGSIVAATGFTIYARVREQTLSSPGGDQQEVRIQPGVGSRGTPQAPQAGPRVYGLWTVAWAWY